MSERAIGLGGCDQESSPYRLNRNAPFLARGAPLCLFKTATTNENAGVSGSVGVPFARMLSAVRAVLALISLRFRGRTSSGTGDSRSTTPVDRPSPAATRPPPAFPNRPPALSLALPSMPAPSRSDDLGQTRNGGRMASKRLPPVLPLALKSPARWTAKSGSRDS